MTGASENQPSVFLSDFWDFAFIFGMVALIFAAAYFPVYASAYLWAAPIVLIGAIFTVIIVVVVALSPRTEVGE